MSSFLEAVEAYFQVIGANPESLEGWKELKSRFQSQLRLESPVMIATLYGPSGSGKSTIFRNLTGLDVPAGGAIRPCSMACVAAVPESLGDLETVNGLFPMHSPRHLDSPTQVRNPDVANQILFANYQGQSPVDLVLVDVPDFNTVEITNWDKAEKVLERSELVLFVVYDNAYSDEKVVRELLRCCSKAARLAYVLTMTGLDSSRQIWNDLVSKVARKYEGFFQLRADGKSFLEFLEQSPVYYSPRSPVPSLADIQPLHENTPPFDSLLRGFHAEQVILAGLKEPGRQCLESVSASLDKFQKDLESQNAQERGFLQEVAHCASKVACHEFPTPRLVEIILEESRRRRSWWVKVLTKPFEFPGIAWKHSGKRILDWFNPEDSNAGKMVDRETLEKERLADSIKWLENSWRGRHTEMAGPQGELSAWKCADARASFQQVSLPASGLDWELEARRDLEEWAREHPVKSALLATIPDVAMGGGVIVLVADLCTTGGAFSTVLANLGVGGMIGGALTSLGLGAKFLEEYHLKTVVQKAQVRWNGQRARELETHFLEKWMQGLLGAWRTRLQSLRKAPEKPLQEAMWRVRAFIAGEKTS